MCDVKDKESDGEMKRDEAGGIDLRGVRLDNEER